MSDFLDESYKQETPQRPVFLTVLCILTFVSCGLTFMTTLYSFLAAGIQQKASRSFGQATQQQDLPEMAERMAVATQKLAKWTLFNSCLSLGNIVICLAGALLMWRLKKSGFYLYTFGQLLPLFTLYVSVSIMQHVPVFGVFWLVFAIVSALFSVGFVVMYGLNLKHMRL